MSDSVWYYARGDQEKGPITTVQIKALAAAGKLHKEDFVWKEGMENWSPAGEVPGLFADQPTTGGTSQGDSASKSKQPQPSPGARSTAFPAVTWQMRSISRVIFAVGLLMALLARGCDSLGHRNIARRAAIAETERTEFQDTWDAKRDVLRDEQQRLEENPNRSNFDDTRLEDLTTTLAKLDEERTTEERSLRTGRWRENDLAAARAEANHRIWGYWRQAVLLLATVLLTVSVLGVAYTSEGPERWISFILLVVIVYSLFASESVWSRIAS